MTATSIHTYFSTVCGYYASFELNYSISIPFFFALREFRILRIEAPFIPPSFSIECGFSAFFQWHRYLTIPIFLSGMGIAGLSNYTILYPYLFFFGLRVLGVL